MAQAVNQLGNTTATECGTSEGDRGGCTVLSSTEASYGSGFAAAGGGVYVAEFASEGIRIWFFSVSRCWGVSTGWQTGLLRHALLGQALTRP